MKSDNPFDFPSAFWFGWKLCMAVVLLCFAVGFARFLLFYPGQPVFAWVIPIGLLIDAGAFCAVAVQARHYQNDVKMRDSAL